MAYYGSVRLADGRVLLSPRQANDIGIYDPAADTLTQLPHGQVTAAFMGAVLTQSGAVVFASHNCSSVGRLDIAGPQWSNGLVLSPYLNKF